MRPGPAVLFSAVLLTGLTLGVSVWSQTTGGPAAYRPSRNAFGQPDLQGIWQVVNTAAWDIQDHAGQRFPGLARHDSACPPGQGSSRATRFRISRGRWRKKQENFENRATADPEAKCYLPGVPRITYMPYPFQIFQFADRVVILYEYLHTTREIYTDGSPHPDMPVEFWMGDSRGRWEGTRSSSTSRSSPTRRGSIAPGTSTATRCTSSSATRARGPDHMLYEVTIEDPKVFTRPWKMSMPLYRRQETQHSAPRIRVLRLCAREKLERRPSDAIARSLIVGCDVDGAGDCRSGAAQVTARPGARASPRCFIRARSPEAKTFRPPRTRGRQARPAGILAGSALGDREHRRASR